jgi:glycosyltransferase involved in cell wall biosynthesis
MVGTTGFEPATSRTKRIVPSRFRSVTSSKDVQKVSNVRASAMAGRIVWPASAPRPRHDILMGLHSCTAPHRPQYLMSEREQIFADIILICNSLEAGGIERVVTTLANEWSRCGRKVCVITQYDRHRFYELDPAVHHLVLQRSGVVKLAELPGIVKSTLLRSKIIRRVLEERAGPIRAVSAANLYQINFSLFFTHEARVLRRAIQTVGCPLVVSFGTSLNILTLKACQGLDRRVIVSERSDGGFDRWASLSRRYYGRADVVTANSHGALERLARFVDEERLAFVPNPVLMPNGDHSYNGNGDIHRPRMPFFLTVGRLVWDKGCDVLLEAFARLGEEFRQWRLVIAGIGHLEQTLKAKATSLNIADRVDWLGLVSDLETWYRTASVFVLPSRVEGMPNALLEAMSHRLPCIVSDGTPGPLELIRDGATGSVIPVNDASALAEAMAELARDEDLRRRLGYAARARSADHELKKTVSAWEKVIGLA